MTDKDTPSFPDLNRRGFLRMGATAGVALVGISSLAGLTGCSSRRPVTDPESALADAHPDSDWRFLNEEDRVLLAALIPALLTPMLPENGAEREQAIAQTIQDMDTALYFMGPPNQAEFRQLFDLLHFTPTRLSVARVTSSWENVSQEQAEAFLQRWRNSGFAIFNNAYLGLVQVTNAAWFGNPDHYAQMGYPGIPDYLYEALPQLRQS